MVGVKIEMDRNDYEDKKEFFAEVSYLGDVTVDDGFFILFTHIKEYASKTDKDISEVCLALEQFDTEAKSHVVEADTLEQARREFTD